MSMRYGKSFRVSGADENRTGGDKPRKAEKSCVRRKGADAPHFSLRIAAPVSNQQVAPGGTCHALQVIPTLLRRAVFASPNGRPFGPAVLWNASPWEAGCFSKG